MHPTHPKQNKNNAFERFRVTVSQMNKLCLVFENFNLRYVETQTPPHESTTQ